jgi:hypothetical protein
MKEVSSHKHNGCFLYRILTIISDLVDTNSLNL